MSIRHWLFAVALGIAALGSANAQQGIGQKPEAPNPAQEQPNLQRADKADAAAAQSPTHIAGDETNRNAPSHGKKQAEKASGVIFGDTYAQWAMVIISLFALVVSGWAVILLKRTLQATRDAVGAAIKAAQIGLGGERPWIRFDVSPADDLVAEPGEVVCKFQVTMFNFGKSPAALVAIEHRIVTRFSDPDMVPTRTAGDFFKNVAIFPGEEYAFTIGVGFPFPHDSWGATLHVKVTYRSLLTNQEHWVNRKFGFHAANGPFGFSREVRLPKDQWGFFDDGKYEVDV